MKTILRLIQLLFARPRTSRDDHPERSVGLDASVRVRLNQMVDRLDRALFESQQAFAEEVNALRSLETRHQEAEFAVDSWADKAKQAALRLQRQKPGSSKIGQLSELVAHAEYQSQEAQRLVLRLQPEIEQRKTQIALLKRDLQKLETTRADLEDRRSDLRARSVLAAAEENVAGVLKDLSHTDSTSEMAQIEEQVRQQEARATGVSEVAALADPERAFNEAFDQLMARTSPRTPPLHIRRGQS